MWTSQMLTDREIVEGVGAERFGLEFKDTATTGRSALVAIPKLSQIRRNTDMWAQMERNPHVSRHEKD